MDDLDDELEPESLEVFVAALSDFSEPEPAGFSEGALDDAAEVVLADSRLSLR